MRVIEDLICTRPLFRNWYLQLVMRAVGRVLDEEEYYERHHVVPKSLGGSNAKSNIVFLTFREHFLAHWLLARFTQGEDQRKMRAALYCLGKINGRRCWASWQLEVARRANRLAHLGKKRDPIVGQRISAAKKGVPFTQSHKIAIAEGQLRRDPSTRRGPPKVPLSLERSTAISVALKGKPKSASHSKKVGAALREVWKRPGYNQKLRKSLKLGWIKRRQKFGPTGIPA